MPQPPEYVAHDGLLGALWPLQSIDAIKLVARVSDPRIGNADSSTIYVCMPDTHIVSRQKIGKKYTYGFNHERTYVDVLKALVKLQKTAKEYRVVVLHMGDCVDLWKEDNPDPRGVFAQYQGVRDYLYGLGSQDSVDCNFLVGNHDAAIAGIGAINQRWSHRKFLKSKGVPCIYFTHGDVFDWIEKLPDKLQQWAVYYFSPKNKEPKTGLESLVEVQRDLSLPVDPGRLTRLGTRKALPFSGLEPQVGIVSRHKFLDASFERVSGMNKAFGAKLSVAVIGHTHNAQMSVIDEKGKFFVLMDCGAWCGSYAVNATEVRANSQIGVICGNDVRIYQLDSRVTVSPQFQSTPAL